jgi:hypothetical protein
MQELLQHDDLLDQILAGKKHSTTRKGRRDVTTGPLKIRGTESNRTIDVHVTFVSFMKFKELNPEDAEISGYDSVKSFKSRLCEIYGDLDEDQEMTVISWSDEKK